VGDFPWTKTHRAARGVRKRLIGIVVVVYLFEARPYQLRWGATNEEAKNPMPGDELDPNPTFLATRAITIEGTPQEIWPWLMQITPTLPR